MREFLAISLLLVATPVLAATINGTSGPDILTGTSGNDVIRGGSGADRLDGRGGNDQLFGDAGKDRFTGGTGGDVFVVDNGTCNIESCSGDTITDYDKSKNDRVNAQGSPSTWAVVRGNGCGRIVYLNPNMASGTFDSWTGQFFLSNACHVNKKIDIAVF